MKRTFQPNNRRRHMKSGFRVRMRTREVERLKNHREFVAVLKRRRRVSDADIVLHYVVRTPSTPTGAAPARRLGLAVSKSVGNAVVRNTVKRRFRVLAHRYEHELPADCDIVLRAEQS